MLEESSDCSFEEVLFATTAVATSRLLGARRWAPWLDCSAPRYSPEEDTVRGRAVGVDRRCRRVAARGGQFLFRDALSSTGHPHDQQSAPDQYTHPLYHRGAVRHPASSIQRVLQRYSCVQER